MNKHENKADYLRVFIDCVVAARCPRDVDQPQPSAGYQSGGVALTSKMSAPLDGGRSSEDAVRASRHSS